MVHCEPTRRGWAIMTLWGVLLTSGVGNTSENTHTSSEGNDYDTIFYIDSAAGSYIDSFIDSI